eukprot:gnl/Chilomastix_cuspidata/5125.p1 GENE.gnl/Chilomastix_cuspidata/5125~~gnl/Chilomastix_cuspidata/5125.p1  ORF type:complete len:333 (+),score=87.49 gnl/Chilomastix_cuspidata/5125:280-1278(+)
MIGHLPVWKRILFVIVGQLYALSSALSGFFTTKLNQCGVSLPMTQNIIPYFILAFYLLFHRRRSGSFRPHNSLWQYLIVAFCDFEANYGLVWAYSNASVSLVSLLLLLGMPAAMVTSLLLGTAHFTAKHFTYAALGVLGMVASLIVDVSLDGTSVAGALVGLASSLAYGALSANAERMVTRAHWVEYVGFLGLFGVVLDTVQSACFEASAWATTPWSWEALGWYAAYVLAVFVQYGTVPLFLTQVPASFHNMNYLTVGVYGLILEALFLGGVVEWYEIVCLVWVIVFIALMVTAPSAKKNLFEEVDSLSPTDVLVANIQETSDSTINKSTGV